MRTRAKLLAVLLTIGALAAPSQAVAGGDSYYPPPKHKKEKKYTPKHKHKYKKKCNAGGGNGSEGRPDCDPGNSGNTPAADND